MIVALLAATVLLTDATSAATSAAAKPAAAQRIAENNNRLICKSEPVLGSRMPVKKCHTVGDAAQEKFEAQQALERMQGAMANNPH